MTPAKVLLSSFLASACRRIVRFYSSSERIKTNHTCTFCSLISILLVSLCFSTNILGQADSLKVDTTVNQPIPEKNAYSNYMLLSAEEKKKRQWLIGGLNVVGYGTSIVLFNEAWYKDYPKTSFHTFDDSKEWQQMDKAGHSWAAYNAARASTAMWRWAGLSQKKATWIGGLSSTAYLTVIEVLDAHSAEWGWSWADMGANLFGSGLFIAQELGWKEQRIQFKFSFHRNDYNETQLEQRADQLYGKPWYERMLKDYNAQTYWLSVNLKSFLPKSNLPAWLNVSVGYGADGMFGGFENKWMDQLGNEVTRYDIPRKRQFYLAPDIDFTKIKTKSKFLRTAFSFLNAFKCPAPALMIDSKGKVKAYALYF